MSTTLGVLPPFLLGAMSFEIRDELAFTQTQLGAAIAVFFATSALASVHGGRLAERVGAKRGMSLAVSGSVVVLLSMALLARSWWHVVVLHLLGGAAMTLATSASSLSIARLVAPRRQGVAFGLSKGAGPSATMLAGAAVPAIALTVGWRWAYALVALGAIVFFVVVPDDGSGRGRADRPTAGSPGPPDATPPLVLLAIAMGFGIGASNAMGAFFVESAVGRGFDPGLAGSVLAVGSLAGIVARAGWGWLSDHRQQGQLGLVALLMAVGGVATLGLGVVSSTAGLVIVAVLAFGAGWGWTGLIILAVVRLRPDAPAAATGITASGMFAGATLGPLAYGVVAHNASYLAMWALGGFALVLAAALVYVARRTVRRRRRHAAAAAAAAAAKAI